MIDSNTIDFPVQDVMYWEELGDMRVKCVLCPRECQVADLERGYCGVRENKGGRYYTLVHSKVCALHIDAIEAKPLFHFLPGTKGLSMATVGCNMECKFCQNWQISQFRPEQVNYNLYTPDAIIKKAKYRQCSHIAYTYTEPVIFYEFMLEIAEKARQENVANVMVSNGYIQQKPLRELCKHVDAIKIDLKSFTEKFYRDTCNGKLKPVLNTLVTVKELGVWLEIVVLIIPTLNDSSQEIRDMCRWIKTNLGSDVPIHFTRYYPTYKIKNIPPTPLHTLGRARRIAKEEGFNFAYVGNAPGHEGENTYCSDCKELIIKRTGFQVLQYFIEDEKCRNCNSIIPGTWNDNLSKSIYSPRHRPWKGPWSFPY